MEIQQNHLIAAFMVIVVVVSAYVNHQQSQSSLKREKARTTAAAIQTWKASIAGCKRNSARVTISATGWDDIARARVRRGESPLSISAVSTATKRYVPLPKGVSVNDPRPYETQTVIFPNGKREVQVTQGALVLQEKGCLRAYPHP